MGSGPDNVVCKPCRLNQEVASVLHSECQIDEPGLRQVSMVVPTRTHFVSPIRDRLVEREPGVNVRLRISQPQICMAVEEALANAIFHGNLEISSELREDGSTSFRDLAEDRQDRGPWKDRVVRICKLVCSWGLWITITDEGHGFDTQQVLSKTTEPTVLLSSGRGLMMMKAFTDDLCFNHSGNGVTLAFYSVSRSGQATRVKRTA